MHGAGPGQIGRRGGGRSHLLGEGRARERRRTRNHCQPDHHQAAQVGGGHPQEVALQAQGVPAAAIQQGDCREQNHSNHEDSDSDDDDSEMLVIHSDRNNSWQ